MSFLDVVDRLNESTQIPAKYLDPESESSRWSNRTTTPMLKQYFKKKVKFDAEKPQKLPWIFLSREERNLLADCKNLTEEEILTEILPKFECEVFLQRPDSALNRLLRTLAFDPSKRKRFYAVKCLTKMVDSLSGKLKFCAENSVERFGLRRRGRGQGQGHDDDEEEEDYSYRDEIDVLYLRDDEMDVEDFALLLLSTIATVIKATKGKEDGIDENLLDISDLFQKTLKIDSDIKNQREILRDIFTDLTSEFDKISLRLEQLLILKLIVEFCQSTNFGGKICDEFLSRFALKDPTLILTQPGIYAQSLDLCSDETKAESEKLHRLLEKLNEAADFMRIKSGLKLAVSAIDLYDLHEVVETIPAAFKCLLEDKSDEVEVKAELLGAMLRSSNHYLRTESFMAIHSLLGSQLALKKVSLTELDFIFEEDILRAVFSCGDSALSQRIAAQILTTCRLSLTEAEFAWVMRKCDAIFPLWVCQADEGFAAMFQPEDDRNEAFLSPVQLLEVNMMMMFVKEKKVRKAAAANLKFILSSSQQCESGIPDFARIVASDLEHLFVHANKENPPRNLAAGDGLNLADLIGFMENSDLAGLELMVKDPDLRSSFLQNNGFSLLNEWLHEIFERKRQLKDLPKIVHILKILSLHDKNLPLKSEETLKSLLRSAFFLADDPAFTSDLAAVWFIALFGTEISIDEGFFRSHFLFKRNLNSPLNLISSSSSGEENEKKKLFARDENFDSMLKVIWNVKIAGGIRNFDPENYYLNRGKMKLTGSEIELIRQSSSRTDFRSLKEARDHDDFRTEMNHLRGQLSLEMMTSDHHHHNHHEAFKRVFEKFFLKPPSSDEDRALLLDVIHFLGKIQLTEAEEWIVEYCKDFKLTSFFRQTAEISAVEDFYLRLRRNFPAAEIVTHLHSDSQQTGLAVRLIRPDLLREIHDRILTEALALVSAGEARSIRAAVILVDELKRRGKIHFIPRKVPEKLIRSIHGQSPVESVSVIRALAALLLTDELLIEELDAWNLMADLALDPAEYYLKRTAAVNLMRKLASSELGPVYVEPVSGLKIRGLAAIQLFSRSKEIEPKIVEYLTGEQRKCAEYLTSWIGFFRECRSGNAELCETAAFASGPLVYSASVRGYLTGLTALVTSTGVDLSCSALAAILATVNYASVNYNNEGSDDLLDSASGMLISLLHRRHEDDDAEAEFAAVLEKYYPHLLKISFASKTMNGNARNLTLAMTCSYFHVRNRKISLKKSLDRKAVDGKSLSLIAAGGILAGFKERQKSSVAALSGLFLISDEVKNEVTVIDDCVSLAAKMILTKSNNVKAALDMLTNLCHRNGRAKQRLSDFEVTLALHRLTPRFLQPGGHPDDLLTSYLRLLLSAASECPSFRCALIMHRPAGGGSGAPPSSSILNFLLDELLAGGKKRSTDLIKLIMVMCLQSEARRIICRSAALKRMASTDNKKSKLTDQIALLDILLTITSFSDGQTYVANDKTLFDGFLFDVLLGPSQHYQTFRLAISVLRNLCFSPQNSAKLCNSDEVLEVIHKELRCGKDPKLALECVWALASSSLKSQVLLRKRTDIREQIYALKMMPDEIDLLNCVKLIYSS